MSETTVELLNRWAREWFEAHREEIQVQSKRELELHKRLTKEHEKASRCVLPLERRAGLALNAKDARLRRATKTDRQPA